LLIQKGQTVKPIKFDLKLADGTKLATLDNLEENLTPELLEHFYSGKLAKWLRVRKLNELADALDALLVAENDAKHEQDVQLFKKFCEIFVSEVDEEDAREAMKDYKPSVVVQDAIEEVEEAPLEIIEPKKEYKVNERLLYKTFVEFGNDSKTTYIQGETLDEGIKNVLVQNNIEVDDVIIHHGRTYHEPNKSICLTKDCLFFIDFENKNNSYKIPLKKINFLLYLGYAKRGYEDELFLIVNTYRFFYKENKGYYAFYEFLMDYLDLKFEDEFEKIEIDV
jgi:hypothetical protein